MKKIKYFIVLCCINFSFGSEGGGFFEQWFMPDTALFLWSVITFLIVLGIGFVTYYLVRHPIKSLKVFAGGIGLLALGSLVTFVFLYGLFYWGSL